MRLFAALLAWSVVLASVGGAQDDVRRRADSDFFIDAGPEQLEPRPFRVDPQPRYADPAGTNPKTGDDLDALLNQDLGTLRRTSVAPALDTVVSTVSRQPSTVGRSPAAVFVITREMIHRSGARSVPEALRLAPGLHVARIDGNKWAISSRGFADRFSNKLLVQIDGRVVYTPLFAGVYWDVQDLLLDDIERIEVIRGPGATIWGFNAVNGVINIITRSARDTHGVYALAGGGNQERSFAGGRVGGETQHGVHWRVSAKAFDRAAQFEPAGRQFDDWRQGKISGRADVDLNELDSLTVQGDLYTGRSGNSNVVPFVGFTNEPSDVSGGDVLARWNRTYDEHTSSHLQVYYDRTNRTDVELDQHINLFDIDFHQCLPLGCYQQVVWGLAYRSVWDDLPQNLPLGTHAVPTRRTSDFYSAFVQDQFELLTDKLYFTAGTKVSTSDYTGFEIQPSGRILWLPDEKSAAWGAISRAVRIPSRFNQDGVVILGSVPLPPPMPAVPITLLGDPNLKSEALIAYELGYRQQTTERFSWDLALFYNVYDGLHSIRMLSPFPPTMQMFNGMQGEGYGGELTGRIDVSEQWRILAWYSFLRLQMHRDPASIQPETQIELATPVNQAFLMSSWDLGACWQLDVLTRYVDAIRDTHVPSYISLDSRLAWRPKSGLELSVVGQNLLDSHHPEFGVNAFRQEVTTEVRRGVYGMIVWEY